MLPTAHVPLSTPAVGWQEDVFIGELKFDDKEGNTVCAALKLDDSIK